MNVKLCQSERYLAVLVGHRLQNNQDNIKYLIIYEQDLENKNFLFKYVRILPTKLGAVGREIEFYNKKEFSALNKMEKDIEGYMIKELCWRLKVDKLGNMLEILK